MAVAVASKATDKVHQTIGADYNSQRDNLNLVGFKRTLYEWSMHLPAPYELGTEFPLALSPTLLPTRLSELVAAVKKLSASGVVRVLLTKHGAIYFRDVGVQTAADFSQFAAAFGWPAHEDIGNPVRRTVLAPNVATANEGPNTQPIYPHNEFGLSPHYPQYVLFYCAGAPEQGGETPINSSIVLYERLKETVPEFLNALEAKPGTQYHNADTKQGVKYQLFYPKKPRDNVSSPGTSVLQSYGKKILDSDGVEDRRAKIEKEIKRLPTATWQWENQSESNQLGDLRVWQRLPGMLQNPDICRRVAEQCSAPET
ncbi:MAG: hypothetical protein Q9157_002131 [Trypethelium eluteriae]